MSKHDLIAAAGVPAGTVPSGYRLVPAEPTGVMKDCGAGSLTLAAAKPWAAGDCYRAMVAAAPRPPEAAVDAHAAATEPSDVASLHLQDLKHALAQARQLRQQLTLMEEQARGEVWRWQGDGTDDLASMGNRMGVLIYACDLRALLAKVASPVTYVNSAGIVASDMPGTVVRKLLAAFHKAAGTPNTDAAVQIEKGGA